MSTKKLFTIGFTKINAKDFFTKLKNKGVKRVIDVRLKNSSQLAGFAKSDDLKFFLNAIGGMGYLHMPELAPTDELLKGYKKNKISWDTYEKVYMKLLDERDVEQKMMKILQNGDCLLCSERMPSNCHRRLLAEFLADNFEGIEVCHL